MLWTSAITLDRTNGWMAHLECRLWTWMCVEWVLQQDTFESKFFSWLMRGSVQKPVLIKRLCMKLILLTWSAPPNKWIWSMISVGYHVLNYMHWTKRFNVRLPTFFRHYGCLAPEKQDTCCVIIIFLRCEVNCRPSHAFWKKGKTF